MSMSAIRLGVISAVLAICFGVGVAVDAGCWTCGTTVRFDCTSLGVKTINGQCNLLGIQWDCDFTGAAKKHWCRPQLFSTCTKTPDCVGTCQHTFGGVACKEAHTGC